MSYRPYDLRQYKYADSPPPSRPSSPLASKQDTTYSQHSQVATKESNPAGNPDYAEKVDREQLLKNLDTLNKLDLVRLSRSSYLSWSNRYNVKN